MSEREIVFTPRARQRLEEIADYLYRKSLSKDFVKDYLKRFEVFLGHFRQSIFDFPQPQRGNIITAQGNALGYGVSLFPALKGRLKEVDEEFTLFKSPFQG